MKSGKKRVRGSKCIGGNVQKNLFFLSVLPDHLHHFLLLFLFSACFLSFYHITQFLLFHLCRRKSREKMSLSRFHLFLLKRRKKKWKNIKSLGSFNYSATQPLSLSFFSSPSRFFLFLGSRFTDATHTTDAHDLWFVNHSYAAKVLMMLLVYAAVCHCIESSDFRRVIGL